MRQVANLSYRSDPPVPRLPGEADAMPADMTGRMCQVGRPFVPCNPAELAPLLAFLARGEPAGRRFDFPRGTLLPDGRLDLCKQGVGPAGAAAVAGAVRGHPQVRHLLLGADGLGDGGAEAVAGLVCGGTLA